jgi:hypothetical protein
MQRCPDCQEEFSVERVEYSIIRGDWTMAEAEAGWCPFCGGVLDEESDGEDERSVDS